MGNQKALRATPSVSRPSCTFCWGCVLETFRGLFARLWEGRESRRPIHHNRHTISLFRPFQESFCACVAHQRINLGGRLEFDRIQLARQA